MDSDLDELVIPGADADLLGMLQTDGPVGVRVGGVEVVLVRASAQAWSSATGSKEANMPTSGTMGTSFSPWQSQ